MCKFTKEEVKYKESSDPVVHRCAICEHYCGDWKNGECDIVEGPIEGMYGCDRFDKDLIVAVNDIITIANPTLPSKDLPPR